MGFEGFALQLPVIVVALAAGVPSLAKSPAGCEDVICVERLLPPLTLPRFNEADCAGLDGRMNGVEDLGFHCRLRLARARATKRKSGACSLVAGRENYDWDAKIKAVLQPTIYSALTFERLQRRPIAQLPESYELRRGPYRQTAVFERAFRFRDEVGEAHEAELQTFFCLAANPKRQVPYYVAIKVDGRLVSHTPIDSVPLSNERILDQIGSGFEPDYMKAFEIADLDGSGTGDILVLSDHVKEGFFLTACLHQSGQDRCRPLGPSAPIDPPEATAARLSVGGGGRINLDLLDERGRQLHRVRYRIRGSRIEMTGTERKAGAH